MSPRTKLDPAKRGNVFYWISKVCVTLYGWFPVLGRLRSAVAIIRRGDQFVIMERNDGHGLCLPGGMSWPPWEPAEKTLVREVQEETGLRVTGFRFVYRKNDDHYLPSMMSVYEVEAEGELHSSWEGVTRLAALPELLEDGFICHDHIFRYLAGELPPDAILTPDSTGKKR